MRLDGEDDQMEPRDKPLTDTPSGPEPTKNDAEAIEEKGEPAGGGNFA